VGLPAFYDVKIIICKLSKAGSGTLKSLFLPSQGKIRD